MNQRFLRECLLLLLFVYLSSAAKILVYCPSISASHIISNSRIADTLAKAGHDVVIFIPEYDTTLHNFDGVKIAKVIRMTNISRAYMRDNQDLGKFMMDNTRLGFAERLDFEYTLAEMCEALLVKKSELQLLKDYKFDVAFAEQIDLCGIGVIRYLGIENLLWISTTPLMDAVSYNLGIPAPTSYVPTIEENDNSDVMSFWDRAFNLYMYIGSIVVHRMGTDLSTAAFRRHVDPSFPNIRDIAANSSLCFVNADEMFDLPRPIIHKTIYVGGLGLKEPKPLDEKFSSIMEKGKRGVIVFSLGSIAAFDDMKDEQKSAVAETVRMMPEYHFIVKIGRGDTTSHKWFNRSKNVDIVEWIPQTDILAHPRIKLFIMHGGLNGLTEALHEAVPVVVIPVFADQFRNGRNAERRGVGKVVLKQDLTAKNLATAAQSILNDDRYKENAIKMRKLMKDKPFSAEERLVKWTEFAADHGVLDNLHIKGAYMSFIVYFNLDIFAAVFAFFALSLYFVMSVLRWTCSSSKPPAKLKTN